MSKFLGKQLNLAASIVGLSLALGLLLFYFSRPILASGEDQKIKVITLVNPIRGRNLWKNQSITPLQNQYQAINNHQLSATWLIQYDALFDSEILDLVKSFDSDQEIGLYLEVSEKLASDVGVPYQVASGDWARPDKVYLSGYRTIERKKMLDQAFTEFKDKLGYAPTAAGAWHVDPLSLNYLKKKYNLVATIGVADQFDTDANRQWGQYWGYPYYPSKFNALKPAQTLAEKLDVVKIQWALRDPLLGYGPKVHNSNFSLQANDYVSDHKLNTNYFKSILNSYLSASPSLTQATVGLEVGQEGFTYHQEFVRQLELIKNLQGQGVLVLTMSQFAQKYTETFPQLSPEVIITSGHYAGQIRSELKTAEVTWFMSPKVRARFLKTPEKLILQDLRLYPPYFVAIDLWLPQPSQRVIRQLPSIVDQITLGNQKQLEVDPKELLSSLNENQIIALVDAQVIQYHSLLAIQLGNIYQIIKEVIYSNLSHFVWSRLDKAIFLGVKINSDTFLGFTWPFSFGTATFPPQALSRFIHLGALVDQLPAIMSGPEREAVKYTHPGEIQILDHDYISSPKFNQWQRENPGKQRLFSNSSVEVWHQ